MKKKLMTGGTTTYLLIKIMVKINLTLHVMKTYLVISQRQVTYDNFLQNGT